MTRTSSSFVLPFLLALQAAPTNAQTNFFVLKSFLGASEGSVPHCTLVSGKDGALYGTTVTGGTSNAGTVFKVNKDGSGFTTLSRSLGGPTGSSGPSTGPFAGLVIDPVGNSYGTTYAGGISNFGTVFKLSPDGQVLTTLHSFTGNPDGKNPRTALVLGSDDFLYGTADSYDGSTRGTVFKLSPDGSNFSVLHTFIGAPSDGQNPCKLIEGSDGRLYGTTQLGGPTLAGTVFTLQEDGSGYLIAHGFPLFTGDGKMPKSGLLEGSDGALYGTTDSGGTRPGSGTVFRLTKDLSSYSILHTFETNWAGGLSSPYGELIEGPDGALYGVTQNGGSATYGTIFKLNKDGTGYGVLRSFTGANGDGETPYGGLLYDGGFFYGTTALGGASGAGTVYTLINQPFQSLRLLISVFATSNLVQFVATSGAQYDVLRSTDLSSWSTLGTVTSPVDGQISFPDLNPPQFVGFYRLRQH